MAHITFYEKPGCAGNAKQRALLLGAGHTLERRDLLQFPWTTEHLLTFLAPLPVESWFNRSAPRVKRGEVVPEVLTATQALALLLDEPLLIRRPLMQREDGQTLVGFETAAVERFLGPLSPTQAVPPLPRSLEGCAATREPAPRRDVRG